MGVPRWIRRGIVSTVLSFVSAIAVAACAAQSGPDAADYVSESDKSCLSCHDSDIRSQHWSAHGHLGAGGFGCTGCHSPHGAENLDGTLGPSGLLHACAECHVDVEAQFLLPYTHRAGTGVECTSCHDPHLGSSHALQKHERHDACISCHIEYRGPYTYEHEGDERLVCMSCHEPHGSGNRRMLTYPDSMTLCISCHPLLEDHDLAYPIWRDCLNCHTEVHGSRWDRSLLR
jgi:DmsE family decaheme c-type cytochrome